MMSFTTKPPFKFYIWFAFSILFTTYLFVAGMVLWGALFYGVFGIVLLYWVASSKDCRVTLNNETIAIKFHKTFWRKKVLVLKDVDHIEFVKSDPFWRLIFIYDKVERHYRSLDKLILVRAMLREEVLINTNHSDLQLLITHFKRNKNISL